MTRLHLPTVVVWDVGRVLVEWDLGLIYRQAIPDAAQRARFVAEVVSEEWHGQHDAGVPWTTMVAARSAEFPEHADLIARYASHWLDSIPGPVAGTHDLVGRLAARACRNMRSPISASMPGRCSAHFPISIIARTSWCPARNG
jgi:UDP:flavonoid glycosyltransferase YjiC (YdhE family)